MGKAEERGSEGVSELQERKGNSLADVRNLGCGTVQKALLQERNPAGPEQVVRVPITELPDR